MAKQPTIPHTIAFAHIGESALVAGSRQLSTDGKNPSQLFLKDVISKGDYSHPKYGWKLPVDHARMDRWADTFNKMKTAGVDVEVLADHGTPSKRSEQIRGYVKDMFRQGDQLMVKAEMRGDHGIKLADTVRNVSVEIDDFADGKGNKFPDAITAVAIVEKPVIPGQQEFKRIAASIEGGSETETLVPIFALATEPAYQPGTHMAQLLSLISQITGKTVADEAAACTVLQAWATDAKNGQQQPANDKIVASIVASADPDALEEVAEAREVQLQRLVDAFKIIPAVQSKLHAALIGNQGERKTLSLSTKVNKQLGGPMAKEIFDALAENDPQKLAVMFKERGGPQILAITRQTPDDQAADAKADADTTKRMTAMAGGKVS